MSADSWAVKGRPWKRFHLARASPTQPPTRQPMEQHISIRLERHPATVSETPAYCTNMVPKDMADHGMQLNDACRTITEKDHTSKNENTTFSSPTKLIPPARYFAVRWSTLGESVGSRTSFLTKCPRITLRVPTTAKAMRQPCSPQILFSEMAVEKAAVVMAPKAMEKPSQLKYRPRSCGGAKSAMSVCVVGDRVASATPLKSRRTRIQLVSLMVASIRVMIPHPVHPEKSTC
mmetsp:Transcript_126440/g.300240  ORF Transcript_126440/g.300240 Transcript_126440/m.300240 type:complete len:233 (-) Transcript_126440:348-1046(-)